MAFTAFARRGLRLGRPLAAGGLFAGACGGLAAAEAEAERRGCPPAVHAELSALRPGERAMRRKWEEDEDHWHTLPPRAWPEYQPKPAELGALRRRLAEACPENVHAPWWLQRGCVRAKFDLATCLTFNMLEPAEGLERYRELASHGDLDAMVGVGVVLLEGIGRDIDRASTAEGLGWIRRASERGVAQAQYELGVLHYVGEAGHVACDEAAAFGLFEAAAEQQHTSALFMAAECLIEGCGCERDPARAVRLLHAAAVRGHRMARANLREWLDEDAGAHGLPVGPHGAGLGAADEEARGGGGGARAQRA